MRSFPATALFLVTALSGSLAGQAADPGTRTLTTEGIAFKKPAGWDWQSEIASNIAIKKELKVKEQTHTITGEMVFAANGFVEDTISGIEKKVKTSKGDLRDFKVTRGEKFAGATAAMVTFARVRGEKQDEIEDERQYLLRRNGSLYTWTERANRQVAGAATSAFSSVRGAFTWTSKDTAREPKIWPDVGIKYVLPTDFEYEKFDLEQPTGNDAKILLHIGTNVTVKHETFYIQCNLWASKSSDTLSELAQRGKSLFASTDDIQDFKMDDKQQLKGEKVLMMSFTTPRAGGDPAKPERGRSTHWWIKRKGYLLRWIDLTPANTNPAIDAALKKARDALTFP